MRRRGKVCYVCVCESRTSHLEIGVEGAQCKLVTEEKGD